MSIRFVYASPALLLVSLAQAQSTSYYEISKSGHSFAVTHDEPSVALTSGGTPFGTVPDQQIDLRRQVSGLAIADIDGDGQNDFVAVCYVSNSFPPYDTAKDMIFYGNGSGINTTPGWLSDVDTHTADVAVGDINNDGLLDIVSVHGGLRTDNARAYFNAGSGMPTAAGYTSSTSRTMWATACTLADMDQDGDLELISTNQSVAPSPQRPVLIFDNNGSTLSSNSTWQSFDEGIQNGVDARDITGDGFPELAVAKWVNYSSAIYYNTTGTPDTLPFVQVGHTDADKGAAFGDVDGDGVAEVAFGGDPSRIYDNFHGALFERYQSNPPFMGPEEVEFVDIDHDGDDDFLEILFSDGRAHIYINDNGTISNTPDWTFDASEVGTSIAIGDLNNDGRDDLALGYAGNTCVRVFFAKVPPCPADLTGEGTLDFFDVSAFLNAYNAMDLVADFTGDGVLDFFDVSAFLNAYNASCP